MRLRRAGAVALVAMTFTGCSASILARRSRPRKPVVVVVEGSAFRTPSRQGEAVRAVEQATGQPVVLLREPAARAEAILLRVAPRFPRERTGLAAARREQRCAADAVLLAAVEAGGVALYRIELNGESGAGSVASWSFTGDDPRHVRIARRPAGVRLDVGRDLAGPLRRLAFEPEPRWNDLAQRVLSSQCPGVALAIVELRGDASLASRRTRAAALASLRQLGATARARGEVRGAEASIWPATSLTRPSCQELCELHIVQLCNEDRFLWSYHRAVWEPTACGRRRTETFLAGCYEDQRTSGTFDDACLRPCEENVDARERLESILASAGCLTAAAADGPVSRAR